MGHRDVLRKHFLRVCRIVGLVDKRKSVWGVAWIRSLIIRRVFYLFGVTGLTVPLVVVGLCLHINHIRAVKHLLVDTLRHRRNHVTSDGWRHFSLGL